MNGNKKIRAKGYSLHEAIEKINKEYPDLFSNMMMQWK